jgi:hypothetical protein
MREVPQPTDLSGNRAFESTMCHYCLKIDKEQEHYKNCKEQDSKSMVSVENRFGIVIPERSRFIWSTSGGGFANIRINIQGTYIPLGKMRKLDTIGSEPPIEIPESLNDRQRKLLLKGLRASAEYEFGTVNLGHKLVNETLDGVYADSDSERQEKMETREERVQDVWKEINSYLPFTYERVAPPKGQPQTMEGMRWINITGHNSGITNSLFFEDWVDVLADMGPVAMYYPNRD